MTKNQYAKRNINRVYRQSAENIKMLGIIDEFMENLEETDDVKILKSYRDVKTHSFRLHAELKYLLKLLLEA